MVSSDVVMQLWSKICLLTFIYGFKMCLGSLEPYKCYFITYRKKMELYFLD